MNPAETCNAALILQVVRIQVQIQETLRRQYSQHPSVQGAITQLDSELMDITKVSEGVSVAHRCSS